VSVSSVEGTHAVCLELSGDIYRAEPGSALCSILVGGYQGLHGGLASDIAMVLAEDRDSFAMTPVIIDGTLTLFSATSPRIFVATNWLFLDSCVVFFL
jgi:hypothetical protein